MTWVTRSPCSQSNCSSLSIVPPKESQLVMRVMSQRSCAASSNACATFQTPEPNGSSCMARLPPTPLHSTFAAGVHALYHIACHLHSRLDWRPPVAIRGRHSRSPFEVADEKMARGLV